MSWADFLGKFEEFLFDIDEVNRHPWNDSTATVLVRKAYSREDGH